jgi:FkbM family methyltransferase
MDTYSTPYGRITLYKNEVYIGREFKQGKYWDIDTLQKLQAYVPPNRDVLEIGGHCGTSSIIYASFLQDGCTVHVYEPQRNMYNLLVHNVEQNGLQAKIKPVHAGVFCYEGEGVMNGIDLDGGGGVVQKRYTQESNLGCNFGGIGLGTQGETVRLTTIDAMKLSNIGFIHCDAQGAENFIFAKGLETIRAQRPVIYYEDNQRHAHYLYDNVCRSYPQYPTESRFDIQAYCMNELGYTRSIERFNGGIDTLLLP